MKISLSNAYYMCAKNTTNPIAKNVKDFQELVVTNLIGPPPNCHLKPQASFHLLYHQQKKKRKMLPEYANIVLESKASRMEVWVSDGCQQCALIRAFACFIRTLVCSKKKHQILKTNNLLSNHAFCMLELFYSSDFVFGKMNYK